jgi:hypothetical protein
MLILLLKTRTVILSSIAGKTTRVHFSRCANKVRLATCTNRSHHDGSRFGDDAMRGGNTFASLSGTLCDLVLQLINKLKVGRCTDRYYHQRNFLGDTVKYRTVTMDKATTYWRRLLRLRFEETNGLYIYRRTRRPWGNAARSFCERGTQLTRGIRSIQEIFSITGWR